MICISEDKSSLLIGVIHSDCNDVSLSNAKNKTVSIKGEGEAAKKI